jgi:hypothetical protein
MQNDVVGHKTPSTEPPAPLNTFVGSPRAPPLQVTTVPSLAPTTHQEAVGQETAVNWAWLFYPAEFGERTSGCWGSRFWRPRPRLNHHDETTMPSTVRNHDRPVLATR